MKMLEDDPEPRFDFCYIDGVHNWADDGFAFFLIDRLLVACQGDGTTWLPAAWDQLKLCVSIIAGLLGGQVHVVVVVVVAGMRGLR